jgi:HSP20 family molecular chaperone IbpA
LRNYGRSSSATFVESSDGRMVTATFDLPGIKKSQVHVSFRGQYLIVDWETVNVTEHEEDGKIVRDRKEVKCSRTLPMPEGTRVSYILSFSCHVCPFLPPCASLKKSGRQWMAGT